MSKSAYLRELDEQIREKKARQAAEREAERVYDEKIADQALNANNFPWDNGRIGGGGDPFYDESGGVITDLHQIAKGEKHVSPSPKIRTPMNGRSSSVPRHRSNGGGPSDNPTVPYNSRTPIQPSPSNVRTRLENRLGAGAVASAQHVDGLSGREAQIIHGGHHHVDSRPPAGPSGDRRSRRPSSPSIPVKRNNSDRSRPPPIETESIYPFSPSGKATPTVLSFVHGGEVSTFKIDNMSKSDFASLIEGYCRHHNLSYEQVV